MIISVTKYIIAYPVFFNYSMFCMSATKCMLKGYLQNFDSMIFQWFCKIWRLRKALPRIIPNLTGVVTTTNKVLLFSLRTFPQKMSKGLWGVKMTSNVWEIFNNQLNNPPLGSYELLSCHNIAFQNKYCLIKQLNSAFRSVRLKSTQKGVVDFNYFLLQTANRFINKVNNVISLVSYYLIFSGLHPTFKRC